MRRLFALLLLLLMPVQFAFAAAAPYCALEKAEVAAHFGHHEHPDAPAPAKDDGKDRSPIADDCGVCHLGSAQAPLSIAATFTLIQAELMRAALDHQRPHHLQEPTDRPPRTSLA